MLANRFFSAVVRIQTDRGHVVVSDGPYRVMRHPGYAGGMLSYLASPLLLSSLWMFIPAVLTVAAMVARTALEDRTLRAELPGYADYARRVRYRLLPGLW
jgi:protein-S-isoprenylcysteine O-methyltransferase Ste14